MPAVLRRAGEAALLLGITLAVYWPALRGGALWDDAAHITPPALRPLDGLRRIWFEPGATQQYYPLLHTVFWIEHRLWGDAVLGYHLINVFWHVLAACLLAAILRRLRFTGAWIAALLFALHPVEVEAVAWISEQKSTLSAVFYLAAALIYLDFDRSRRRSRYALALALFLCALATKTVTATLPAALLVVFWWQRGTLSWRKDARPLVPWFAAGAAAGLFTAWVERHYIGATGPDFALPFAARILIAGRDLCFYAWKLIWPANLIFIYPRWTVDPSAWWQYLFPAASLAVAAALLVLVRRGLRGPLAAFLFFAGTLFPALGFFNVFPFIYSFVADHFQYLAGIGILVPVAWALSKLPTRIPAAVLLAGAALLANQQTRMYADAETLWRTTLARNPGAWLAHNDLGLLLEARPGGLPEAIRHFQAQLRLKSDLPEAHVNLGSALSRTPGRLADAIAEYETALRMNPGYAMAHADLGIALAKLPGRGAEALQHLETAEHLQPDYADAHYYRGTVLAGIPGRMPEAIDEYQTALRLKPGYAEALVNLGSALAADPQRAPEALGQLQQAVELNPNLAAAHFNLANALLHAGRMPEAIAELETTLGLDPDYSEAQVNLGAALAGIPQRAPEAVEHLEAAIRLRPDDAGAHYNLGNALSEMPGRANDAVTEYRAALRLKPDYAEARLNLASVLADLPGHLPEAIAENRAALRVNPQLVEAHCNLALALARTGNLSEAIAEVETALRIRPDFPPARTLLEQLRRVRH
ncbi:MAG TPA: tetratricopeptide repeat protein [Bryobacteraceae bacterium]|nr:tetratricopeptide repeat protein [Bryobacteraceae bacterium]